MVEGVRPIVSRAVHVLRVRSVRASLAVLVAASPLAAASCAPPTGNASSSDGGVSVAAPTQAAADVPVDVALTDTKGTDGPMALTPFASSTPSGDVTFAVKNLGTVEHEMIVVKTDVPFDQIPINATGDPPATVARGGDKIDETSNVGETGDPNLKPGDTRTFTIKGLAPGKYVLACNLAHHYGLGMRAALTVT